MATARLIPSTSAVSNSSYATISSASNMYTNTDSTTHGTFTHNRASTNNTYYGYLRGFNFSAIPESATVTSFTIKIKASATGHTTSTSSSYYMSLVNGTTQIGSTSASGRLSTSVTTFTFAHGSLNWDTIKGYGANFGIRIPMRRASSNTADIVSVYGAEIEVEYTVPNPRTVTTALNGDGTISPSGSNTYYDGDEVEVVITPLYADETVTATRDGVDITNELVAHYDSTTMGQNLGAYTLVSGGFNSGESYFQGIVGHGSNATQTTSNYYSSGSGVIAVFTYDMGITLSSDVRIERVWCEVNGHAESTSNASEYMCAQLISGNTALSEELNFKNVGTSNSTQILECETVPTVSQLASMKLQCRLGYYGGAINGATCYVTYSDQGAGLSHYTYTFIVDADTDIDVTIGSSTQDKAYLKVNESWVEVSEVYKKMYGVWIKQTSLPEAFDSGTHYKLNN